MDALSTLLLEVLSNSRPPSQLKRAILSEGTPNLFNCVCQCCLNALNGSVAVTPTAKERIKNIRKVYLDF